MGKLIKGKYINFSLIKGKIEVVIIKGKWVVSLKGISLDIVRWLMFM